jgi:hypothetical protein
MPWCPESTAFGRRMRTNREAEDTWYGPLTVRRLFSFERAGRLIAPMCAHAVYRAMAVFVLGT